MVGFPVVVVTSYILYRRGITSVVFAVDPGADGDVVVLGAEQKVLVPPIEGFVGRDG